MVEENNIKFTEDQKEVLFKNINSASLAINQLFKLVENDRLNEETRETLGQLLEFAVADITQGIGFDSLTSEKVEEKYAEIRKANETIRELEKQIAQNNPVDKLDKQISYLSKLFEKWWRKDGFNYVRDIKFLKNGLFEAELGFSFQRGSFLSNTPNKDRISKVEWMESLKEKGYQIYSSNGQEELIDCPENRSLLLALLKERFPSVVISDCRSQLILKADSILFELNSIKVLIYDLNELKQLESYVLEGED